MALAPLSSKQVDAYLKHLEVPEETIQALRLGPSSPGALKAVTRLQQCHLAKVPFENLDMHYSTFGYMQLDSEVVFDRIVGRNRGGLCFEAHPLLARLLMSLGFSLYLTGGRLNAVARLGANPKLDKSKLHYNSPWAHVVVIVTIGAQQYVVDTNLGPQGSPVPIPLHQDEPIYDMAPRQRRLIFDNISSASPDHRWWRMQGRPTPSHDWYDIYCFSEHEWLPIEFEVVAKGLGAIGVSWFADHVVCCRALFEDSMPVGYLMIHHNELRRQRKGKIETVQKFHSERDRVVALKRDFGIALSDAEKKAVQGRTAELKESFDYYG